MSNLRIALFHANVPATGRKPGGSEVYVARLARAMADRGHAVEMWTYDGEPLPAPVVTRHLRPRLLSSGRLRRQYLAPASLNLRRTNGIDVIHLFGDDWFFSKRRVPSVRTMLGSAIYESATADSRRRRVDQALLYFLERRSARLADATFGIGVDSRTLYQADGILPSGISPAPSEMPKATRPTVLFVGAWLGRKRGRWLQETFEAEVIPRVPDAELVMVSDHARTTSNVRHVRSPTDNELRQLYAEAWSFCLPSTYEGFGLPYLEALSHGLEVIASPNSGALWVLGGAGTIVEDASLGEALTSSLSRSAHEREGISRRALARAAEFAWPSVVDAHENAYHLAIRRFNGR